MDRDQLINEIIFDKLMRMTDNKDSVRRLRVREHVQTMWTNEGGGGLLR